MVRVLARRREGYSHDVEIEGGHKLVIDEPVEDGGANEGPSPTRTLGAALAACTAITVEMYAQRKEWDVGDVAVDVDYELDPKGTSRFEVVIEIPGDVSEEQAAQLKTIAGKCPVHRVLIGEVEIKDEVRRV